MRKRSETLADSTVQMSIDESHGWRNMHLIPTLGRQKRRAEAGTGAGARTGAEMGVEAKG